MNGDSVVQMLWFAGAFTLVLSSLLARRLPMADWLKMALAWVAIFGLVFLAIRTWQVAT
ncbi:Putative aspartyl protease (fragment) [uncultured Sphingopyxis sp.]|uniref:Putative aspartyl protease n=1 Tax=uncultured Sphingopyxis sp. TaxID=310581 RepID=A0A1Y5PST0_9SPHN